MTAKATNARPAWTIHPPDIRKALKLARSRCYTLIGVARRNGNQPVVDAFTVVLDKIKDADQAVRDAKALYGWEGPQDEESDEKDEQQPPREPLIVEVPTVLTRIDTQLRNPCCGNTGTHSEGSRDYCSTCGQELK